MDLINKIRRENGCDEAMLLRAENDPEIFSTIKALQGNASRGLDRLSDELYARDTHFLLEFIQNADDNDYADNVIPTLKLTLDNNHIYIGCNEVGFSEQNVAAICKIGESTKKNMEGYIGEKGIGFKSVFKIADEVSISSGIYTFKLDRNQKLGMITPIWTPSLPVEAGWTNFDLLLKSSDPKALSAHLKGIKPSLFLFLRRLRCLTIKGPLGPLGEEVSIEIHRSVFNDDDADVVTLQKVEDGRSSMEKYFTTKGIAKTYPQEDKRKGISESVVVLAFPLTENEEPKISSQDVHAFLPLRSYGFNFIIQADFLTASSREDIMTDLKWNIALRNAISATFLVAVEKFKTWPTLQFNWFQFLPFKIDDPFFKSVKNTIISELSKRPILCSDDGQYDLASKFIIASNEFCDADGIPLVPEKYLPDGLHYLTLPYNIQRDRTRFECLGVLDMSNENFIQGLLSMESQMPVQPTAWHEAVCRKLCQCWYYHSNMIRNLHILPLGDSDRSWVSGGSTSDICFNSGLAVVPQDLGLRFLRVDIPKSSSRYELFVRLKVSEADPQHVAQKILRLHRSYNPPKSLQSLVSHAIFMFNHRHSINFPSAIGLRVMDKEGLVAESQEVYADIQSERQTIRMCGTLRPPARFLHREYLLQDGGESKAEWESWLLDKLGVNLFPRLIKGQLSPEFEALVETIETHQLLTILKETWPHWSTCISEAAKFQLSEIVVDCEDGSRRSLKTTYLKRGRLAGYTNLPFLPIDEPNSPDWDFLPSLKVTLQMGGTFFLGRLIDLKDVQSEDEEAIYEIYSQLQARFEDDEQGIRDAFGTQPLIFVSANNEKKWIHKSDTVWTKPPSMKSKVALKKHHPALQKLFRVQLGVPIAGPEALVDELLTCCENWKGQNIPEDIKSDIFAMLYDISHLVREGLPGSNEWIRKLSDHSIFPVKSPSRGSILCARNDHFYVPDASGRFQSIFSSEVPLLDLPESYGLNDIHSVLDTQYFNSHLKYLETEVKHVSSLQGMSELDIYTTEKLASKAEFIARLVSRSHNIRKLLDKFRNIKVHTVDSIETLYTLEDFSHTGTDQVVLEERNDHILILKTRVPHSESDISDVSICEKLAALLNIDLPTLLMIVSLPPPSVEAMLKAKGIGSGLADGLSHDPSWMQGVDMQSHTQSHAALSAGGTTIVSSTNMSRPDMDKRLGYYLGFVQTQVSQNSDFRVVTSAFNGGMLHSYLGPQPGTFPTSDSRDVSWDSELEMAPTVYIARESVRDVPTILGTPSVTFPSVGGGYSILKSQASPSQLINGILGEFFVYLTLSERLPEFGPKNWTSEFRGKFPGLEPYENSSLADFMYSDCQGVLSTKLFDKETIATWKGEWPNYHIEVKSTSGGDGEKFHMSRLQIQHAFNMTIHRSINPPKELYIIFRVSNVLRSPTLTVYPDPHRLFYAGDLRIVSDVEVAIASGNS